MPKFKKLFKKLKVNSLIYCMPTDLVEDSFSYWYYGIKQNIFFSWLFVVVIRFWIGLSLAAPSLPKYSRVVIRFLFVSGTHPDSVEIFKRSTLVNNKGNHLLSIWALVQSGWKSQLPLFLSWKQRTAVKEDADILHIEIHVTEVWAKTAKKNYWNI